MTRRSQLAWGLLVFSLAALALARLGNLFYGAVYNAGAEPVRLSTMPVVVGVAAIGVLAGLLFLVALGRVPRRAVGWVLAVQAVCTFAPYPLLLDLWGPIAGILAATLLLGVRAPLSWLLFAVVIAVDLAMSAVYVSNGTEPMQLVARLAVDLNVGLSQFAVARLAELTTRTEAERDTLTRAAVAGERLDAARRMRTGLGAALATVLRLARGTPGPTELARINEIARDAADTARSIADTRRAPSPLPSEPDSDHAGDQPTRIAPRLAHWVMIFLITDYTAVTLVNLVTFQHLDALEWTFAAAALAVSVGLQLYHGAPRADGSVPRAWPVTLPVHLTVMAAAVVFLGGLSIAPPLLLAAGAVLVRVRVPWSWLVVALLAAGEQLMPDAGTNLGYRIYMAASVGTTVVAVYAYCRIPEVIRLLTETRGALARLAVTRERQRAARNVHDLLGFTIVAIGLKSELIRRLLDTDPDRAAKEAEELRRLAERGIAEVRAIGTGTVELVLAEELEVTAGMLDAAGVRLDLETIGTPLPPDVDALFATVLREAVTNVVRHSTATTCHISVTVDGPVARLLVSNDGHTTARGTRAGSGLANLATRVEEASGRFDAGPEGDRFVVTTEVPLPVALPTAG